MLFPSKVLKKIPWESYSLKDRGQLGPGRLGV